MKNLSDFKKRLKIGAKLETYNHALKRSFGVRTISSINTVGFTLLTETKDGLRDSRSEYLKAKDFEIINDNEVLFYWGVGESREPILTYKFID